MKTSGRLWIIAGAICIGLAGRVASAQDAAPAPAPAAKVKFDMPENVQLKVFIDYVGKRLDINFLYDEQVANRQVTIKAPREIPADSLMTLLSTVLKMKGMTMVPTGVEGTMRIEASGLLTTNSVGIGETAGVADRARSALAMTRVFDLKHAKPQQAEQVMKPFLSAPTAAITVLEGHDLLIVTDYADNMKRLENLLAVIDRSPREVQVRFVPVLQSEATQMAQNVKQLLDARAAARGGTAAGVTVVAEERTNQLVVVGVPDLVGEAATLIGSMDAPLGLETKPYPLAVTSPEQVDRTVRKLIGDVAAKRFYKSAFDRDAGVLLVTATPAVHRQIEAVCRALDKPMEESQSPVRFYKLKNAKAEEVLETIRNIEGDAGLENVSVDGVSGAAAPAADLPIRGPTEAEVNTPGRSSPSAGAATAAPGRSSSVRGGRVMADKASNTIIIVAKPSMQTVYEKLIARLDVRRPQVLVEATLVSVDTTNDFSLGIEINDTHTRNGRKLLTFTQFGLTKPDAATGGLALQPGIGFNGVVLKADVAEAVIHALKSNTRAKVVSRPAVLVNDNAKGVLLSESEEPFASVNASTTVATTSFGGYSSAGTKVTIAPQISEGDYLKLDYEITLSSFGTNGTTALPPSRQTNSLNSQATIPNGNVILIGGLTRESYKDTVDRVPLLGSLPVLEYLFSSRTKSKQKTTLFVFIHAVILRDDKFEDLRGVSGEAAGHAGIPGNAPASEPVGIR